MIQVGSLAGALISAPVAALACDVPDNLRKIRNRVVTLTNPRREKAGLPALGKNARLHRAAQGHACWMADNNLLSHTGEGGSTMATRITAKGYTWSYVSENVAYGQTSPREVIRTWMQSPPHRVNMLNELAKEIGIGYALNGGRPYWVMVLAAPR